MCGHKVVIEESVLEFSVVELGENLVEVHLVLVNS